MKRLFLLFCLNVSLCLTVRSAIPEPDWTKRHNELRQVELATFKSPRVGDRITVIRRVGGPYDGTITAIGKDVITLGGKKFQSEQLTPECCDTVFAEVHADNAASKRLQVERDEYDAKRRLEQEQLAVRERLRKEESLRVEKARKAAEDQARVREEEQARQAALQVEQAARQEQERNARNVLIGVSGGVIVLCVLGFVLYILPSVIAFKRGHQNAGAILALNLLLGWTFLGWVAALVWSLTQATANVQITAVNVASASNPSQAPQGKRLLMKKRT